MDEDLFGEGPQSALSHVIIPDDMLAKLPAPLVSEMSVLDYWAPPTICRRSSGPC